MLTLGDAFSRLSYGKLSNLALSGDGGGYITDSAQPKIVNCINTALLDLYGKFVLSEKSLLIEQVEHITNYHIDSRFAESRHCEESRKYPYIKDLCGEPYTDDLLRILTVFNGNGCRMPLNDDEHPHSLFTPVYNILQVPNPQKCQVLTVNYQAKHDKITGSDLSQIIYIPEILEEALLAHIAYSVYDDMNNETSQMKAQSHFAIFTGICENVRQNDLVNSSLSQTNSKFEKRGFV